MPRLVFQNVGLLHSSSLFHIRPFTFLQRHSIFVCPAPLGSQLISTGAVELHKCRTKCVQKRRQQFI